MKLTWVAIIIHKGKSLPKQWTYTTIIEKEYVKKYEKSEIGLKGYTFLKINSKIILMD